MMNMNKLYFPLLVGIALVLTACPGSKQAAYTDAVCENAVGPVEQIAVYDYRVDDQGNLVEFNGSFRSNYSDGLVTDDNDYMYYEEPEDEWELENVDYIPVVERDAEGRIVRKYHIVDDDTVSIDFIYNRRGLVTRKEQNDRHNDWLQVTQYTYDKRGCMVAEIYDEYQKGVNNQHDSTWYNIEETDSYGNWIQRERYSVSVFTYQEDNATTRTTYNEHERQFRYICYAGDSVRYQPLLTNIYEEKNDSTIRCNYISKEQQTAVEVTYYIPIAEDGYDVSKLNETIAAWLVPESEGKTVSDRLSAKYGQVVETLPNWDAEAWLNAQDTYPARVNLGTGVYCYYCSSRMAYFQVSDDRSSSPSGSYVYRDDEQYAYDLMTNHVIRLRDIIRKDKREEFCQFIYSWSTYHDEDEEEELDMRAYEEEVLSMDWVQFEQRVEFYSGGEQLTSISLSDLMPYLNKKGMELLWLPSVFMGDGFYY